MTTLMPARLRRSVAALVFTGGFFVGPAQGLRAEDNGDDAPAEPECPTWKTCDARCGDSPPILDGSPGADAKYDEYLECQNRCLREVFDCITQQANTGPVTGGVPDGGVLDPGGTPDFDRGVVIFPDLLDVLEPAQPMVFLEPGQSVSSADTNGDEHVDMSDALLIFNYLFIGGVPPGTIMVGGYPATEISPQLSTDGLRLIIDGNLVLTSGDTDASGRLDMVDPMRILLHLFSDGKAPVLIMTRALRPPRPPIDDIFPDVPPIVLER